PVGVAKARLEAMCFTDAAAECRGHACMYASFCTRARDPRPFRGWGELPATLAIDDTAPRRTRLCRSRADLRTETPPAPPARLGRLRRTCERSLRSHSPPRSTCRTGTTRTSTPRDSATRPQWRFGRAA